MTGEALVVLETHHESLKNLEKSALDFYPVLRSAYYQDRVGNIWGRREHRRSDTADTKSGATRETLD